MDTENLVPHLFRTEYSKITAVICKQFGLDHLDSAEDIASETFLLAMETWAYNGIPPNPTAWLYTVAKNKAKNHIKHNKIFAEKIIQDLKTSTSTSEELALDLSFKNINDSQLQMLFAICHPSISVEAQISLALRILCGFGIEEIASAFLTTKETIHKRLYRAKEKLRKENIILELPQEREIEDRLETVLRCLYLLFSEGYYSESENTLIRKDLCLEAIRLAYLLLENNKINNHSTHALLSLFCFHASRFEARENEYGELILYEEQNVKQWNQELIERGFHYLVKASEYNQHSKYYLEASIAYWHTVKNDTVEKWTHILHLYNYLLQIEYSPAVALNRIFALSKSISKQAAILEAEKLVMKNNRFYFLLLGELYKGIDNHIARDNFKKAYRLAKTKAEKQAIEKNIKLIRIPGE